MILELTIENFKSFRECEGVRFTAGTSSKLPGNLLRVPNRERFVKSMALYGPNASGKTTILDGLYALGSFVLFSAQDQKPTSRIRYFQPFELDLASASQPTRITVTLDLEGDRFTLDVSATSKRVWNEILTLQRTTKQPSRKARVDTLIERTWVPKAESYRTTLHEDIGTELTRKAVLEQTTHNRLMVGKLASMNNDVARRLIEWFDEDVDFYDMHRNPRSEDTMLAETARLLKENEDFAAVVARFMKDADIGVQELRIDDEKTVEAVLLEDDKSVEWKEKTRPSLLFRHTTKDGSEVFFHRQRESSGTLRFVALLAAILKPGPRRRLVCIDEISASMHPDLVRRLVRIVHSRRHNKLGNQVLFTTHDTHLMNPSELLRRDQVTICSKDRFGRSRTKRLDEFQDTARSDANLQKQYLQGRFGGIPQFGPTLEDVPIDDDPLEVGS
ncbi:MAG: ATP/GTP-binding protein [Gemmataceae bacterium]